MAKFRKTDKMRLKENRGQGFGNEYKPWILPHEVPSEGRSHKLLGWKYNRIYSFLSDGELWAFLRFQMEDNIIDIREQFPLLPLDATINIADKLNIIHPPIYKKDSKDKYTLSSDFNLLVRTKDGFKEIVRTLKTEDDYKKIRTQEKLLIEKEYWLKKGIDWGVILHNEESKIIGKNIYSIYQEYFWNDKMKINNKDRQWLICKFKNNLIQYNMDIIKTTDNFEKKMFWQEGEGLSFFKYLITHKEIKVNLDKKLNYDNMNVWF